MPMSLPGVRLRGTTSSSTKFSRHYFFLPAAAAPAGAAAAAALASALASIARRSASLFCGPVIRARPDGGAGAEAL